MPAAHLVTVFRKRRSFTYYVNPVTGDDGNAGTTRGAPWKSTSKSESVALSAGQTVGVLVDGVWTLHRTGPYSNTSFLDHFTALNSRWTQVVAGTATISYSDSNMAVSAAGAGNAAFAYLPIDLTKSQLIQICWKSDAAPANVITLVNGASAPATDTFANITAKSIFRLDLVATSPNVLRLFRWNAAGTQQVWNNATGQWTTNTSSDDTVDRAQAGDYYIAGFEVDAVNSKYRWLFWHRSPTGSFDYNQGLFLLALTDWMNMADLRTNTNLWLCLGKLYTESATVTWSYEFAKRDDGTLTHGWHNCREAGSNSTLYKVKHCYGYVDYRGGLSTFVPDDFSSFAVDLGAGGQWDDESVKDPHVVKYGSTYYMLYSGNGGAGTYWQIGLATASSPAGPWTKQGVLLSNTVDGDDHHVGFPCLVYDPYDPDADKRWKIVYDGINSGVTSWNICLATAPAITGPWTKQGILIAQGSGADNDANGCTHPRAFRWGGEWIVLYGARKAYANGTLRQTTWVHGTSFAALTKSGTLLTTAQQATVKNVTANMTGGVSVTLDNTTGLAADMVVMFQQNSATNGAHSRIRKVTDGTHVELYHGINGFTANQAKMIAWLAFDGLETGELARFGSEFWLYPTVYGFYTGYASESQSENVGLLTAQAGPLATYTWQHLLSWPLTKHLGYSQRSVENLSLVHET